MKKYFAQLRPLERRLAVAVMVVLLLVLNYIFIWPHFSDWSRLQGQMAAARNKLALYRKTIAEKPKYERLIRKMEGEGARVARQDQAINLVRAIRSQSARSGVGIVSMPSQITHTNEFFVELTQNLQVIANDQQLVDFLYKLGSDASMIRVRDLELRPDPAHHHLDARIQLIASYQQAGLGNLQNATAKPK